MSLLSVDGKAFSFRDAQIHRKAAFNNKHSTQTAAHTTALTIQLVENADFICVWP